MRSSFGALSKTVHARCVALEGAQRKSKGQTFGHAFQTSIDTRRRHPPIHPTIRDYVSRLFWFKLVWVGQAMSDSICTILDTHPPSCIAFATIRARCVLGGAPRSRREPRCCCGCACWVLGALHGEPPQLPNGSRRERGGHHICVRADARAIGNGRVAGDLSPPPCQSRKPEILFLTLSGPHPSPPHPFHQARTIRAPTQYPANNLGPNLRVTAPGSSGAQLQKKFRSGGNPGLGEEQLFTWSMHQLLRWMHHLPSRPGSRFSL